MLREVVLAAAICAAGAALAEDSKRVIGSWLVTASEDRFGDGGSFVAVTPSGGYALAVRCIEKELSLAVLELGAPGPRAPAVGDKFSIKVRVDKEPIVDFSGVAINDRLIQIKGTTPDIVRAIRKGRETAVRIESEEGVSRTTVFATRENGKALVRLARECKVD